MRLDDALWGALLMLFAGALFVHVQGFPAIPGQRVGPSALPSLLAIGLFACGALLFVKGLRARAAHGAPPWIEAAPWWRAPRQQLAFGVLVGVNLLYLLAVQRLGFIPMGVIYLAALMWALRVPPLHALLVAVVLTLAIHACFYKLLKVPLPWGLLQGVAW